MMRIKDAKERRDAAAAIAYQRQHPVHVANAEEHAYREAHSFMSFTKGLPHDPAHGLAADPLDPVRFRNAIDSGFSRDFDLSVRLGARDADSQLIWHFYNDAAAPVHLGQNSDGDQHRRWEAPTAGFVFELEGPDAQAVTMAPAPPMVVQVDHASYHGGPGHDLEANPELVAELAEVYWLACLRDRPFGAFDNASRAAGMSGVDQVEAAVDYLAAMPFYDVAGPHHPRRRFVHQDEMLSRQNVFRGNTPGERKGPYLSQFLLMGNGHLRTAGAPPPHRTEDGHLQYGSISVDMRVRVATPCKDYMTHWNEWLDVQNGANVRDTQTYIEAPGNEFRFIATPRDLATYVHFDALYEAYLNACLWLLNVGAPVDPSFRHLLAKTRHTEGFALFGGPHILSLMTEVATRGLKAVRFQKFNVHLRLRPEALAGLVASHDAGVPLPAAVAAEHVKLFHDALNVTYRSSNILTRIKAHNDDQNDGRHDAYLAKQSGIAQRDNLPLLPMAFPEGSPMHPSYGAGHATVAGACVTILKAFFDENACIARVGTSGQVVAVSAAEIASDRAKPASDPSRKDYRPVAFVPQDDGAALDDKGPDFGHYLRLGDELNKLAANISIGRNMAGVHYYSDYIDSLRMGEEIAIGIIQEQSILYPKDPFHVSLTSFDGKQLVIGEGKVQRVAPIHHQPSYKPYTAAAPAEPTPLATTA